MGLRKKIFNIMGVHWKIQLLGVHEKPIKPIYFVFFGGGGIACKEGAGGGWKVCRFNRFNSGLGEKDGDGIFEGSWYPMHTKS